MRISDWSSDVCSSDLQGVDDAGEADMRAARSGQRAAVIGQPAQADRGDLVIPDQRQADGAEDEAHDEDDGEARHQCGGHDFQDTIVIAANGLHDLAGSGTGGAWGRQIMQAVRRYYDRILEIRSEGQPSELQSIMRISYALY